MDGEYLQSRRIDEWCGFGYVRAIWAGLRRELFWMVRLQNVDYGMACIVIERFVVWEHVVAR
jgi:hypothetical protein